MTRMVSRGLVLAVAAALVVLAGAGSASAAAKITVCPSGCKYTAIQDAINAAPDAATISVRPGTYAGFSVPGTNSSLTKVTLSGGGADQTIISGGAPVVAIAGGVSARIRGVQITKGSNGGISNNGALRLSGGLPKYAASLKES